MITHGVIFTFIAQDSIAKWNNKLQAFAGRGGHTNKTFWMILKMMKNWIVSIDDTQIKVGRAHNMPAVYLYTVQDATIPDWDFFP